jgi:hypothetical protein
LLFHQFPDFPRGAAGSGNVPPRQLGIAFGHLDVRMAEDFRKLVKITPFIMYQEANVWRRS